MKRTVIFLLILMIGITMFSSCKRKDKGDGGGNTPPNNESNVIFSPDIEVIIVGGADELSELNSIIGGLSDALKNATGNSSLAVKDTYFEAEHEIVLGNTARAISDAAKKRLEGAIKNESEEPENEGSSLIGYTVYSNGKSVGIVWSDAFLAEDAVQYFISNFITAGTLALEDGYSKTNVLKKTEYLMEKSMAEQNRSWVQLAEELSDDPRGDEIVDSMKTLYSLYTKDMLYWIANLYDPEIGGWYHSNSARNTEGFLPDIGSTWTALSFMSHTGMVDNWSDAISDDMKKSISEFIISLQDEDGYFYHPQWGKGISSDKREEHLRGARVILNGCGSSPKYPYPGTKSSAFYGASSISQSKAVAVSSVVKETAALPQYESVKAYRDWLDGWYVRISEGKTNFYSMGDELQSQVPNMEIYSEVLGEDLLKITTDFLTSHQRESGLWDDELNYTATNAIHKITSVYNSAKCEIPRADDIIRAGLAMISDENPIEACVDIYNAWSCISYVIKNIRTYASGNEALRLEKADEIVRLAREIAPEAIIGAYEKVAPFRKVDGSFSYGKYYSTAGGAGMNTAVPHTVEGDLSGNSICMTSLISEVYASLDIETFVPLFTTADYYIYMEELSSLGKIVKDTISTESVVIDFEDCDGEEDVPTDINPSLGMGSLAIGSEEENKFLIYRAVGGLVSPQNQPSLDINATKLTASPGYAVMEMDIHYLEGVGTVGNQLMLYGSSGIIMQLSISTQSGAVVIKNSADSTKVLAKTDPKEAFKLRIEYYWNEGYAAIYLNDDDLPSGITTDVYPDRGIHQTFTYLHFGAARAQAGVTKIDNIKVEVRPSKTESEIPNIKPPQREVHDFENEKLGETSVYPLTLNQGSENGATIKVDGNGDNKYLELVNVPSTAGNNPSVRIYANHLSDNSNKSTISFDLNFLTSLGAEMTIYGTNKYVTQMSFTVSELVGTRFVTVRNVGEKIDLIRVPADGWITVRIEYFWNEGYFAFYIGESETPDAYSIALAKDSKGHSKLDFVQLGASRAYSGITLVDNVIVETSYAETVPQKPEASGPVGELGDGNPIINGEWMGKLDFESEADFPVGEILNSAFRFAPLGLRSYSALGAAQLAIARLDGSKYLTVTNGKAYSVSQSLRMSPVLSTTGNPNTAVLEMKMNINATVYGKIVLSLDWRPVGQSTNVFGTHFALSQGKDGAADSVTLKTADGKWHTVGEAGVDFVFRMEYYWSVGAAKIYVNGDLVTEFADTAVSPVCNSGISELFFNSSRSSYANEGDTSTVAFDYITFASVNLDYEPKEDDGGEIPGEGQNPNEGEKPGEGGSNDGTETPGEGGGEIPGTGGSDIVIENTDDDAPALSDIINGDFLKK